MDNNLTDFNFDFSIENPAVVSALAMIESEGLNKMRCVLTGAPYATIDTAEIKMTLESLAGNNFNLTADFLLDKWNLNLFTMCSKPGPLFVNRQELALSELAHANSAASHARIITHYLSKFFYSTGLQKRSFNSDRLIDRMHFTIEWHDYLSQVEIETLRKLSFRLAACDGWLSFSDWKELNLFRTFNNKAAINSPEYAYLRSALAFPIDMDVATVSLEKLIASLESIVATTEATGGVAHIASANKESIKVAHILNDLFGLAAIETPTEVDVTNLETSQLFAEIANHFDYKPEFKRAWSATHGRGYAMNEAGPKTRTAKEAIDARKKAQADLKAKRAAELAEARANKPKKINTPRTEKARRLMEIAMSINFDFGGE